MNQKSEDLVVNRKALHDYEILETLEAGLSLTGTEIKSLRDHGGGLQEAYVKIIRQEAWLIGSHIAPYRFGNIYNHEEKRDRKLLLHRREIEKLRTATQEKGLTLIALALYLKKGWVKARIAVARGKKNVDKRASLKEREDKRYMDKIMKGFR